MKLACVLLPVLIYLPIFQDLQCISCTGTSTDDCDLNAKVETCQINQRSCETVVRRQGTHETVNKGCRETMACKNNQRQNNGLSGPSTQCNSDQQNSCCTCCCKGDLCNAGPETCSPASKGPSGPANDCPPQPTSFAHGNISCSQGVCTYECTDHDYDVYPPSHVTNICRTGAKWLFDTPCCARPCPPYLLYDSVSAFHIRPETVAPFFRLLRSMQGWAYQGPEAMMSATFVYGDVVYPWSVVKFTDFSPERFRATLRPVLAGPANTGAAIQFALDEILHPEYGMRNSNLVTKSITIFTDSNSDDDVKASAAKARSLGYILYVAAFQRKGVVLDEGQMLDITGDRDHVFIFEENQEEFPTGWLDDLASHFCRQPCDHVLHEHV